MRKYIVLFVLLAVIQTAKPQFSVSANRHFILKDGKDWVLVLDDDVRHYAML